MIFRNSAIRRTFLALSFTLSAGLQGACAHHHPHVEASCTESAPPAHSHGGEGEHSHGQDIVSKQSSVEAEQGASEDALTSAAVVDHTSLKTFENSGNSLKGVATKSQGAKSYEVWRTSVAVGSRTPLHRHASEEVFIFLRGKGKAIIGEQVFEFEAPATVIAPANVPHQFINTGDVETDAIVVVGVGSEIYDEEGKLMNLPWRR